MEYYDNKIVEMKEELNKKILNIRRVEGQQRESLLTDINNSFKELRKVFKRFKRELKSLVPENQADWEDKKQQHIADLNKLLTQFNVAKRQANRDTIIGAAKKEDNTPAPSSTSRPKKPQQIVIETSADGRQMVKDEDLERKLFKEVFELQDDCMKLLEGMKKKTETIKELNTESLNIIQEQNDQLRRIDEGLDELGGNIKLARKEFASLARKLATDKLIIVGICCFVLAVAVGIIAFFVCIPVGACNYIRKVVENNTGGSSTASLPVDIPTLESAAPMVSNFCYKSMLAKIKHQLWN